jgi:coenzyme F420-dependent glucose-6-phosphate dehydrogenase
VPRLADCAAGYVGSMAATTHFGMTLSSEEHPPRRLIEIGRLAEASGFEFVSISDHFHPWVDAQGHSPFVWSVLGALAEATSIDVGVGVTCPIMRIHPAILAQATATCSQLFGRRFTWGVGTGEALNEHILADRWPPADLRLEMLDEAIDLIRRMWTGQQVTYRGTHFQVENARIYDPPDAAPPVIVSAFGPAAADLAARVGDGLWVSGASAEIITRWRDAGGTGPVYAQLTLCWAGDRDKAIETAHRIWPNTGVPGQLSQDLPTPAHFEQASSVVTKEQIADSMSCGPDPDPLLEAIQEMVKAGVDHVYLHQIGPDQEGFCDFWQREIAAPAADLAR